MGYWSLAILVISVSFLAYRHPEVTRNALPPWLRSGKREVLSAETDKLEPVGQEEESKAEAEGEDVAPSFKLSEPEEFEQDDETPKSNATQAKDAVPSFSLNDEDDQNDKQKSTPNPPSNPSLEPTNPPPTLSPLQTMPPPPKPASAPSSSLMPPPAPKPSTLMPPPSRPTPLPNRAPPTSTLRTPTTGPLPNRGPPTNSQQRAGSTSKSSKGKILLSPGHSPMDWAALSRNPSANLSGVPTLQRVTPSQLKTMTGRKGKPAWSSYQGKVYNITPYLPFHPGGEPELMRAAGKDGGKLFMEVHPWVNWEGMLGGCVVGIMVGEGEQKSELEEMD